MSVSCPNCGHVLAVRDSHRSELERQLWPNDVLIRKLREEAFACVEVAKLLAGNFIGFRGMVWRKVKTRHGSACWITGAKITAGDEAWRQLSHVTDRDRRVAISTWAHLEAQAV